MIWNTWLVFQALWKPYEMLLFHLYINSVVSITQFHVCGWECFKLGDAILKPQQEDKTYG